MKVCTKCNIPKDGDDFPKEKRNVDGLNTQCKDCLNERVRQRYNATIDRVNQKRRNKYHSDKTVRSRVLGADRKYRQSGGRKRLYYKDRQRFLEYDRKWRRMNPDKISHKNKKYKQDNAERLAKILKESVSTLDDKYVVRVIRASVGWKVPSNEIPPDLIEITRQKIIIDRQLKQKT